MKLPLLIATLFITGCSGFSSQEPGSDPLPEPSFTEDPVYNFKSRVDEGWQLEIMNGKLVFTRKDEKGVEVYQPIK